MENSDNLKATACVAEFGARSLSHDRLHMLASRYANLLKSRSPAPGCEVLLQPGDRLSGIIQFWGIILAGLTPVLDEKRALTADAVRMPAPDLIDDGGEPQSGCSPLMLSTIPSEQMVIFVTSGSTGDPKLIKKSWRTLMCEACALTELFKVDAHFTIFLLISPFHIYGFLHSIMVAFYARCNLVVVNNPEHLINNDSRLPPRIDLLVAVPALWSLAKLIFERCHVTTMVTSGASFGAQRAAEIADYPSTLGRVVEIMGSTETGGIGYRILDSSSADDPAFELFATHQLLDDHKGHFKLISPYLESPAPFALSDLLRKVDERHFHHLGRSDGVFKYAGKRYALAEIERNLVQVLGHENLLCQFRVDENNIKGGLLSAVVEQPEPLDLDSLRTRYHACFEAPFPSLFTRIDRIPRDANGKIEKNRISEIMQQQS
jgi:acyl-coenzyme A synthetase/AMP-(fatty) acid ligase